jgi:hypothetical protein
MAKWADYGVSAVRYDADEQYIEKVRVHVDNGDTIGSGEAWNRQDVVSKLDNGKTFTTIIQGSDGKWKKGQDIHIITVDGRRYLRTDANRGKSDNLESLPRF